MSPIFDHVNVVVSHVKKNVLAADGGYQTFYLGVRYATGRCHAGPTLYAKEVVRANLNTPQKLQDMWPDVCAVGSTPDDMFNLYLALPCTIVAAGKFADPSAPTAAEIQAAVDARNVQVAAALSAVVEDASGNDDAVGATPEQINSIPGVSGALDMASQDNLDSVQSSLTVDLFHGCATKKRTQ